MKTALSIGLLLLPAALSAQVTAAGTAQAKASVEFKAPASFSAGGAARLEAIYMDASDKRLPREPIANRVAEGRAKGASEAAILTSAGKVKANLEASQRAMIAAGHREPTDDEVVHGASAMERGATRVQLEALAKQTPADRSLSLAFDGLNRLTAPGANANAAASMTGTAAAAPKGVTAGVAGTVGGVIKKP